MEPRQPSKTEQALALITALLSLASVMWYMLPEHERRLLAMRALAFLQRIAATAAAGQGHEGMADELAGRGQATQRYKAAYRLSVTRDALGRAIERMRP